MNIIVYAGPDKYHLDGRPEIELRYSQGRGWYLHKTEDVSEGFFKRTRIRECQLTGGGIPFCIIMDGLVVAGKKYNRKLYTTVGRVFTADESDTFDDCIRIKRGK